MAKPVVVTIPHSLGKAEARRRIETGFGRMRSQLTGGLGAILSFTEQWDVDRLTFSGGGLGQKMTGRVDVNEDSVVMEVDLPEVLAAMAESVMGRLKQEGVKLLER
jgi:Putative polyhydroxyalkanoic acid system protein (PHA_gran_rgn)